MTEKDFSSSRRIVLIVSISVAAITLLLLVLVEVARSKLWDWVYAASTNVLAVLFGLAVVSFFWEFLVRKAYSADQRDYLRLGASVAQSGLQDVKLRSRMKWEELLASANEVTVLSRDAEWLSRNLYPLRDTATERTLKVTVAVPSKTGQYVARMAAIASVAVDKYWEPTATSIGTAADLWRAAKASPPGLKAGSHLRIVEHDFDLGYEVVTVDRTTVILLGAPGDGVGREDPLALVYKQGPEQYPTSFLTAYKTQLDSMNSVEEVRA